MPPRRADRDGNPRCLDRTKIRALNHPLRLRILEMHIRMRGRQLSIKTITEVLAETREYEHVSAAEVKYHCARLLDAKLIPAG
jgi:hypothetical protein